MKYIPRTGGHAPGHLRDAFEDWFESDEADTVYLSGDHTDPDSARHLNWLIGQLWNCTDIMPDNLCSYLDLTRGSTYAQGVRRVKDMHRWRDISCIHASNQYQHLVSTSQ